jgi:hypothetical protein
MTRILSLWSFGMAKAQIVTLLGMTPREWRNRVAAIRTETKPGDALMAWARFIGACRERMQQFTGLYLDARKAGHYASAVGAARSMADLDARILDMAIRLGLIDPAMPESESGQAGLSPYAKELEGILMWAEPGADLSTMGAEDLEHAIENIRAETRALQHRPRPPSLRPGN